jgi:hypothetical protein
MGDTQSKTTVPPAAEFESAHSCEEICLGDGTGAVPVEEPGCPIRLRMTMGKWKDRGEQPEDINIQHLGTTGNYGDYAALALRRYPRNQRKPMELIICEKEEVETICVVAPMPGGSGVDSTTNIYSTRPRFEGQIPVSKDGDNQQTASRFLWAKIDSTPSQGVYPSSIASYNTMETVETEQTMKREEMAKSSLPLYRSEESLSKVGPQIVVWKGAKPAALIHNSTSVSGESTTDMTISPGIDPCLVIAFAAHVMNRVHVLERSASNSATLVALSSCCC